MDATAGEGGGYGIEISLTLSLNAEWKASIAESEAGCEDVCSNGRRLMKEVKGELNVVSPFAD